MNGACSSGVRIGGGHARASVFCCVARQRRVVRAESDAKPFEPVEGQAGKDVVVGADAGRARREDARCRQGDAAGLRHRSRLGRRAQRHRRGDVAGRAPSASNTTRRWWTCRRRAPPQAGVARARRSSCRATCISPTSHRPTCMALFLLPQNMLRLRDKFLALKPGSRIVSNTFCIPDWEPDYTETMPELRRSGARCLLWIVPAKIDGVVADAGGDADADARSISASPVRAGPRRSPTARSTASRSRSRSAAARYAVRVTGDQRSEGTVSTNGTTSDVERDQYRQPAKT